MLYKVVNIADKEPFDNIANILIYMCFLDHTDADLDRLFLCNTIKSSEEQQK